MLSKPLRGRRVNQRHWAAKGLVGAWLFNEGCGTKAFDLSGNGNTGTLTNMAAPPTAASGWGAGRRGTGLRFDGDNDYVNCGNDPSLDITDAITIEAWVNPATASEIGRIVNKTKDANPTDCVWTLALYDGHPDLIIFKDDVRNELYDSSVTLGVQWYHFVMVDDGSKLKYYLDGVFKEEMNSIGSIDISNENLNIGAMKPDTQYFHGMIDSVHLYNRALHAEEIGSIYRDEYAIFNPTFYPGIFYMPITARSYGYIF